MRAYFLQYLFRRLMLFCIIAGGLFGFYKAYRSWLSKSASFEIRKIEITGNDLIERSEILKQTGLHTQTSVWDVNLDEIEYILEENPFIADVSVHRVLPDVLSIHITEKQAVALLKFDRQLFCVDPEGLVLPSQPGRLYDLPILSGNFEGGVRTGSFITGPLFQKGLHFLSVIFIEGPNLYSRISELVIQDDGSMKLYTYQKGIPVLLGIKDSLLKIRYLEAILNQLDRMNNLSDIKYIDLRYYGQVILGMRS